MRREINLLMNEWMMSSFISIELYHVRYGIEDDLIIIGLSLHAWLSNWCLHMLEWGQMKERNMKQLSDVNWFHMTEAGCGRWWACSVDIGLGWANMDILWKTTTNVVISLGLVFLSSTQAAFFNPDLEAIHSASQGASPWHRLYFPLEILEFVS